MRELKQPSPDSLDGLREGKERRDKDGKGDTGKKEGMGGREMRVSPLASASDPPVQMC